MAAPSSDGSRWLPRTSSTMRETHLDAKRPRTQCDRLAPGRAVPVLTMRFPVTEYVASLAMVRVRRLLPSPLVIAPLLHSALSAHGNATAWRFPRRTHLAAPRPRTQCDRLTPGRAVPTLTMRCPATACVASLAPFDEIRAPRACRGAMVRVRSRVSPARTANVPAAPCEIGAAAPNRSFVERLLGSDKVVLSPNP